MAKSKRKENPEAQGSGSNASSESRRDLVAMRAYELYLARRS
jgi:hypothetical protein